MKNILPLSALLVGTISLVGCSYFDHDEQLAEHKREAINLTGNEQGQETIVQPAPSIGEVISKSTDGSVEYYSLDGPGLMSQPAGAPPSNAYSYGDTGGAVPVETVSAVPVGQSASGVYSGDPSVQVFP